MCFEEGRVISRAIVSPRPRIDFLSYRNDDSAMNDWGMGALTNNKVGLDLNQWHPLLILETLAPFEAARLGF